ncbi:predicted protein [Uncinocarpus reesii 1704]|uniref:Protein kinase domain-containing protein n=1 Tax=Uncinocarpus reesii (strain UAMH 1704) TaxID=336963 RepID=C4JRJ5_UNCRE|nr:uncharacterized protein UREG_05084 [Uncinocarpus reesii 1704]EEP80242.1 predicted protein [Uncinocarpus reesii 1704]
MLKLDLENVILFLTPLNDAARGATYLPANKSRVVIDSHDPQHRVISLAFTSPPSNPRKGFVFGSGKKSDIRLNSQSITDPHFSIDLSSNGVTILSNKSLNGTSIGKRTLKNRQIQVIEQNAIIGCAELKFRATTPGRGLAQQLYNMRVTNYWAYKLFGRDMSYATAHTTSISSREKIGKYWEVGNLGSGGFGCVSKLIDSTSGDVFAGKRFINLGNSENRRCAHSEIKTLQQLSHPNIVKFIDQCYPSNGILYLVMEYLPGGSLKSCGRLSRSTVIESLRQCLAGLVYLHGLNIMHRDIKPDNIGVVSLCPLQVKLIDFGLASAEPISRTQCGTVFYFAPELFLGSPYTPAVDIWALGITALELLSGLPKEAGRKLLEDSTSGLNIYAYLNAILETLNDLPEPSIRAFVLGMIESKCLVRWTAERCLEEIRSIEHSDMGNADELMAAIHDWQTPSDNPVPAPNPMDHNMADFNFLDFNPTVRANAANPSRPCQNNMLPTKNVEDVDPAIQQRAPDANPNPPNMPPIVQHLTAAHKLPALPELQDQVRKTSHKPSSVRSSSFVIRNNSLHAATNNITPAVENPQSGDPQTNSVSNSDQSSNSNSEPDSDRDSNQDPEPIAQKID